MLGGTFNPPHLGHVVVALHARDELAIERVALIPVHTPPHKTPGADPGPQHRLRMCELALLDTSGLVACELEVERGGPSYTVDTLRAIHAQHPDAHLSLIVGADTARTLGSWREPAELLALASLAVAVRSGSPPEDVLDALAGLGAPGRAACEETRFLEMAPVAVSSSMVRERVARGAAIDDLVGPAVAGYIAENGLYRAPIEALR